ncbi:MAG: hypothetical protein ACREHG_10760, partial [Candidatus Saccharimonadales bacterium]
MKSVLDLAFGTPDLQQCLLRYSVPDELQRGSDHKAILLELDLNTSLDDYEGERMNWKEMDCQAAEAGTFWLRRPNSLNSREEIERYAEELQHFTLDLARRVVPRAKKGPKHRACPWWNLEIKALSQEEQRLRRIPADPEEIKRASKAKKKAIKDSKRRQFRKFTDQLKNDPKVFWKMGRWGKERSHLPPILPLVPKMQRHDGGQAISFEEKADVFAEQFFPPVPTADLSDIDSGVMYPGPVADLDPISKEEVARAIKSAASWKAPGPDGIPTAFLKAMGPYLVEALQMLIQSCWNWQYYPKVFKIAKTVAIRKARRGDYALAKSWRPISLLNSLGKIIKTVTARRIQQIAEEHRLLPVNQMGGRKKRSTRLALD